MGLGEAVLIIAENELGFGEESRNNRGFHLNKYRRGRKILGSGAWCADFVCWCIEEAWCGTGKKIKHLPFDRTPSASGLAARLTRGKFGKLISYEGIEPGDILLWKTRIGRHVNICYSVHRDFDGKVDSIETIDGNKGPFPAVVSIFRHESYPKPLKVIRLP